MQEDSTDGGTDGTYQFTGQKFFDCPPGRGLYLPLANVRPDERFVSEGASYVNRKKEQIDN